MWDWLKQTDPSVVLSFAGGLAAWLYAKARGKKTTTIVEHLQAVLLREVHRLLAAAVTDDGFARRSLERVADTLIARLGLKKTRTLDAIVDKLIDEAMAELVSLAWERARKQLEQIEGKLGHTTEMLEDALRTPRLEPVAGVGDPVAASKVRAAIAKAPPVK